MKNMVVICCRALFTLSIAIPCMSASAQQTGDEPDPYFRNLGRVIGAIRSVDWISDICAEKHPATRQRNVHATAEWARRFKPFIVEMTGKFEQLPLYWASLDPQSAEEAPKLWANLNTLINSGKVQLQRQFEEQMPPEKFRQVCDSYPELLKTDGWDLERHYASALVAIRRGPQ